MFPLDCKFGEGKDCICCIHWCVTSASHRAWHRAGSQPFPEYLEWVFKCWIVRREKPVKIEVMSSENRDLAWIISLFGVGRGEFDSLSPLFPFLPLFSFSYSTLIYPASIFWEPAMFQYYSRCWRRLNSEEFLPSWNLYSNGLMDKNGLNVSIEISLAGW